MDLYKVTNTGHKTFYVVAKDAGEAQAAAERQWGRWGYFASEGIVVGVELVAFGDQYHKTNRAWLLVGNCECGAFGE